MIRTRSRSSRIHSRADAGVAGFSTGAGPAAAFPDQVNRPVQVRTGFNLNGNQEGPGFGKIRNKPVRIFNHQMNIYGQVGYLPDRFHHHRTHRDVGHKMAVHDIHMEPVGAGGLNRFDFFSQPGKSADNMEGAMYFIHLSCH